MSQTGLRRGRRTPRLATLIVLVGLLLTAGPACAGSHVQAVATVPPGDVGPEPADVAVDTLNLRTGPSTACPIRATLTQGTQVTIHAGLVTNEGYDWRHVTTPHGDGYTVADAYQHVAASKPGFVEILMYHHIEAGDDNLHVPPTSSPSRSSGSRSRATSRSPRMTSIRRSTRGAAYRPSRSCSRSTTATHRP